MELTNQVATLQDEVKLLKGEIKAVLKEIRTAVLAQDNPFAADASLPMVSPPNKADTEQSSPSEPTLANLAAPAGAMAPQAEPQAPPAPPVAAAAAPLGLGTIPQIVPPPAPIAQVAPVPAPAPAAPAAASVAALAAAPAVAPESATEPQPPGALDEPDADGEANSEPVPIRPNIATEAARRPAEPESPSVKAPWDILTVAGLAVWAEDALAALGTRRFHFVLELASVAELLPPDVRAVLGGLADEDEEDTGHPVTVNECLVVLRQLEAIVNGERVAKLSRRRGPRHRRIR